MIISMSRGSIAMKYKDGVIVVQGEGYPPGNPDGIDFTIYSGTITWEPKRTERAFSLEEKKVIIDLLVNELKNKNMQVEII